MTCRLVVMLSCLLAGCSAGVRARAANALDQLTASFDPAYSIAMDGCIALERAVVAEKSAGEVTKDQAEAELAPIRQRCDTVRELLSNPVAVQNHGLRLDAARAEVDAELDKP